MWTHLALGLLLTTGCLEGSGRGAADAGSSGADISTGGNVFVDPRTGCPAIEGPVPDQGPRAYVTLSNSDRVAVLDLSDPSRPEVIRCISIDPNADWDDEPFDLAIDASGRWYVTVPHGFGFLLGQLWSFDAGAVTRAQSIDLVGEPDHVVLSPDGRTIYVTALQNIERPLGPYMEPGQFMVIDRDRWEVQAQYPLGLGAAGLDITSDGSLVVITSAGTDELYLFTPDSGELRALPVGPAPTVGTPTYQPFYVALAADETLAWVSALNSNDLRLLDLNTG
ncbi:MAG: hypothetical protein AAFS10_00775, partial [Myxococcota bacterium]